MRDLREFFDPDLKLPIDGTTYVIKSPNADEGLRIRALFADPHARFTNDDQVAEIAKLLGAKWVPRIETVTVLDPATESPIVDEAGKPVTVDIDRGDWRGGVWSEMVDKGITWSEIMHAGTTALLHYGQGAMLAEVYWETGMGDMPGNQLPPRPEMPEVPGERSSNPNRRKRARRRNRKR